MSLVSMVKGRIRVSLLPGLCAGITLLAGIAVACWFAYKQNAYQVETFSSIKEEIAAMIDERMKDHELILKGARGFVEGSQDVSRAEWRSYYQSLELEQKYPGILGMGYSAFLLPGEVAGFEQRRRDEGFSDFAVHPAGQREIYTSILFLEPFTGKNLRAFGYDMMSEATRAKALHSAIFSGNTAMSARVTLLQENEADRQAGMLIYVPVFRSGMPHDTPEARWQALEGFVYSPFRMGDLMKGVGLRDRDLVGFDIYDGTAPREQALMYRSADYGVDAGRERQCSISEFFGHPWTLCFYRSPLYQQQLSTHSIPLILSAALLLAIAIYFTMLSVIYRRHRAEQLASKMTAKLRRKQDELEVIQVRQERVLSGSNDGWWEYKVSSDEVYVSPRFCEQLGLNGRQQVRPLAHLKALLPEEERHDVLSRVRRILVSRDTSFSLELRLKHAKGHYIPLLARGQIDRDASGKALIMSGANIDLTESKRIEAMKNGFISTVSHELRTPLTSISGSLSLVNGGALGDLPEAAQSMLGIAKTNCDRLGFLINDLLDMDKLVAGKMRFDIGVHSLAQVVQKTLDATQGYAEQYSVSVVWAASEEVQIEVDEIRAQQILSNFISNAIKYSPTHGQVMLKAERCKQAYVRVLVIDQGEGIPEDFKPHIFQKFSQADTSTTRKKVGTGLGLAITKELAERMKGGVGFCSEEGRGSTFWVEFPVAT